VRDAAQGGGSGSSSGPTPATTSTQPGAGDESSSGPTPAKTSTQSAVPSDWTPGANMDARVSGAPVGLLPSDPAALLRLLIAQGLLDPRDPRVLALLGGMPLVGGSQPPIAGGQPPSGTGGSQPPVGGGGGGKSPVGAGGQPPSKTGGGQPPVGGNMNANPIVKVEKTPKTPPPPATASAGCPTVTPPDPTSGPTSTNHPLTEDVNADFSPPPCPGNQPQDQQQASAAPTSSNAPLGDDSSNPPSDDSNPIYEWPRDEAKRSGKCLEEAAAEQDAADALRALLKKPKTQTTPAAITAARASWKKAHDDLDDCANGQNRQKVANASPGNQQQGRTPAPKPIPEAHVSPDGTVTPAESKPIEERHKPAVERQKPIQEERKPIAERQKPTVNQADPVRPASPPTKEDVSNKAADLVKKSPSPAPSPVPHSDFLRTQPPSLAERPNSTVMPPAPTGPVGPPPSRPNDSGRTVASLPNPAQSTPGQPVDPHRASDAIIHDPPNSFAPTAAAPTQNDVRRDALRRANDALKAARPATPQGPRPTPSLLQIQREKENALARARPQQLPLARPEDIRKAQLLPPATPNDIRRAQPLPPPSRDDVRRKALAEANKAVTARRPGTQQGSRTHPSALQLQQAQRKALARVKPPQPPHRGAQSAHTAARGPSYKVPQVHSSRQAHNVQPRRQQPRFQPRAAQRRAPVYHAQPRAQTHYAQPRQQRRYAAPRQQRYSAPPRQRYAAPRQPTRYSAPRQQTRYSAPRQASRSFAPRVAYAGRRR
jgi:hypothetical protein